MRSRLEQCRKEGSNIDEIWLATSDTLYTRNYGLLTVLAKRWHNKNNTFHLPTREVMITLEDVYQILRVPSHGVVIRMIMF